MSNTRVSITKKLIHRMLVIEATCFLIVVLLSMWILQPKLRAQYLDIASATHEEAVSKINSTMESLISFSHYIVSFPQLQEQVRNFPVTRTEQSDAEMRLTLNHLASTLPDITGVFLDFHNGTIINSFADPTALENYFHGAAYRNIIGTPYCQSFELIEQPSGSYVVFSKNCYIGTQNCTVTMLYDSTFLLNEVDRLCAPLFEQIRITDQNRTVIYQETGEINNFGTDATTFSGDIYPNMWTFTAQISKAAIDQSYQSLMLVIVCLFFLMSAATVVLLGPFIRKTISPLGQLADTMKQVAAGDLQTMSSIETNDEIGQVSRQFNQMVTDLNTYIDRLIETEQLQQKLKYSLLISQINPHFIYNTMGIISILARNNQTEDILAINNALIKILQDRLRVEHMQISDSVEQEIETLKQYLLIQSYRYEYHVEVRWDVSPEYLDRMIPKNLLQPLVENALFHGLMDDETGLISGKIWIRITEDDGKLLLIVQDNGRGIDDAVVKKLSETTTPQGQVLRGKHIGLRNIAERLAYLYPGADCLQICRNHGTIVRITLPAGDE